MKRVNIYEAKTHLSQMISRVEEEAATYVLCRNGKPVADIVPHRPRVGHLEPAEELLGAQFEGDPCASLDEEDWPEALR